MAFTTSGQETEWAYSYSPGDHTGPKATDFCIEVIVCNISVVFLRHSVNNTESEHISLQSHEEPLTPHGK